MQGMNDKPLINNRQGDLHTIKDVRNAYMKENINQKPSEKWITEVTNKRTGKSSYRCNVEYKGKRYTKTYPSLKQAEIFRDTILRVLSDH